MVTAESSTTDASDVAPDSWGGSAVSDVVDFVDLLVEFELAGVDLVVVDFVAEAPEAAAVRFAAGRRVVPVCLGERGAGFCGDVAAASAATSAPAVASLASDSEVFVVRVFEPARARGLAAEVLRFDVVDDFAAVDRGARVGFVSLAFVALAESSFRSPPCGASLLDVTPSPATGCVAADFARLGRLAAPAA